MHKNQSGLYSVKILFSLIVILISSNNSFSQTANYKNELGFRSDNDAYLLMKLDRYYTNGLFVTFRYALKNASNKHKAIKRIGEAEVGQYIFNPHSGQIEYGGDIDRPFAAYLYAGGKFNWFYKKERVIQFNASVGSIGSSAKGAEVQKFVHKTLGLYEIDGWNYQVKNEAGVNASFDYTALLGRSSSSKADISFNGIIVAGNTFSKATAGFLFRAGQINSFFQSASMNSRISNSERDDVPAKEFFFFTKPSLSFIVYDATIQGGLFRKDKGPYTFSPKRIVFAQETGMIYAKKRWTFDFSVVLKTKEIQSDAKADEYGSISLFYRFY